MNRFFVDTADGRIAITRWGDGNADKPPALLVHGTGFVADVWQPIAGPLAQQHTVYALDRRGHGKSHKPPAGHYHFFDFAQDLCRVIEALDLKRIAGIGHSAGATDLLLAAALLPARFDRVFAMEPTVMDPGTPVAAGATLSADGESGVTGVLRRRSEFDDAAAALGRLRAAPAFADWTPEALQAYVDHGFETLPDGRLRLLCTPPTEAAMLRPIFEAMEQVYTGDERGNPFALLSTISCPVTIATSDHPWPIYRQMAARATALIPGAQSHHFAGVGHCIAQQAPEQLLQALR